MQTKMLKVKGWYCWGETPKMEMRWIKWRQC